MVVEDEQNTREGLIRLLGKMPGDYEVVGEAEDGESGYALISRLRPDFVITDIKMPRMSGIEMLERLDEDGYRHKAIILTGYSEFEYAKKALKMGVLDYLEKPVTAADLQRILSRCKQILAYERMGGLPNLPLHEQTEHLIRQTLMRDDVDPTLLAFHLQQTAGFRTDLPIQIVEFYAGAYFQEMTRLLREWQPNIDLGGSSILFALPQGQSVHLLIQTVWDGKTLDNTIGVRIKDPLLHCIPSVTVCRVEITNLSKLKSGLTRLSRLRRWSIAGIQDFVINEDTISVKNVQQLHYPELFDNRIALTLAESDQGAIQSVIAEWLTFVSEKSYPPEQIINASLRFITHLLKQLAYHYGNEISVEDQQEWLNRIQMAQTGDDLKGAFNCIAKRIAGLSKKPPYSLVVIKAIQIIHAGYQKGINLEEIANALHITPEYLSSIFTKEVGQTYSAYMKEFRIRRAKELLVQTDLRTYEVADKVGYPDAKYFSRVFREVTGLSPGEYQRLNAARGR